MFKPVSNKEFDKLAVALLSVVGVAVAIAVAVSVAVIVIAVR